MQRPPLLTPPIGGAQSGGKNSENAEKGRSLLSMGKQSSSNEIDTATTRALQARVVQLEKELGEKDKRFLSSLEETAHYKSEATQKMKLVVQLQKQLVEFEKGSNRGGNGSSAGNSMRGGMAGGSGSLFGTLFGVASGELNELERLKQQNEVLNEELTIKVKQNEMIRIEFDEYRREIEMEKKQFTALLEREVKDKQQLEKRFATLAEKHQILKTQQEIMAADLKQKGSKELVLSVEADKLRLKNEILARFCHRWFEWEQLTKEASLDKTWVDLKLTLFDLCHWMLLIKADETVLRPVRTVVSLMKEIDYGSIDDESKVSEILSKMIRPMKALDDRIIPFCKSIVSLLSMAEGSHDLNSFARGFFEAVQVDDSTIYFVLADELDLNTLMRMSLSRIASRVQILISEKMNKVTEGRTDKPAILQSDESLLHSIEDCLDHRNLPSPITKSVLSSIEEDSGSNLNQSKTMDSLPPAFQEKLQFHSKALNYLRRIRQLETQLVDMKSDQVHLQGKLEEIWREREEMTSGFKDMTKELEAAQEELTETRQSYDLQLKNFSDRIVELELLVKQREDEIRQMKSENVLLTSIKKNFIQKS